MDSFSVKHWMKSTRSNISLSLLLTSINTFNWYFFMETLRINRDTVFAYLLPESCSSNLYSGMERTAHFNCWCGERKGKGLGMFYTLMKAPHPPAKHAVWYFPTGRNTLASDCPFPIWKHYTARPRQGIRTDCCLRNSHFLFSCRALTDI